MLLGFKKQFAPKILDGSKIHTFRDERKREPKLGETLYMYYNLRNRYEKATKISDKHTLKGKQKARIETQQGSGVLLSVQIWIDDKKLRNEVIVQLISNDGFESVQEFARFFHKAGELWCMTNKILHHWTDFRY